MWGVAYLCKVCMEGVMRASVKGVYVLGYGLVAQILLLLKLLMAWTKSVDALLQGLLWRLLINHTLYTAALLLLYMLCPSLLRLLFRLREWVTLLLLEGLRILLTPCFGDLPPLFYSAVKLAVDLLTGATWLDLLFQHALSATN